MMHRHPVELTTSYNYALHLGRVRADGHLVAPRGQHTRELLGAQLVVPMSHPLATWPRRKLNYRFALAEPAWVLSGDNKVAPVARFNPRLLGLSDDGATLSGAYGPPVREQLAYVVRALRRDPASRQALLTIWARNPGPSKDVPCTVALQFLLRDFDGPTCGDGPYLHCVATMRSNDLWFGTPYDVVTFSAVAAVVAGALGASLGLLYLTAGSAHLYEDCFGTRCVDLADALLADVEHVTPPPSPQLRAWSSAVGNSTATIDEEVGRRADELSAALFETAVRLPGGKLGVLPSELP